ncbi:hypothetical protein EXX46_20980 [Escherichia coli]|nr:hypothetical protein [Escherichia coli]MCA8645959.1 hypothetical protein [Escherichia coli]MCS0989991.1 hypothetical protein [Escherichia coli]MDX7389407.1 hypothetical protein [Escherichia coli]MEE3632059.1 hypothetical protein [Escherichia coli]RZX76810.1 hypothetical protein EXX46_20980 [Escherichia coli]
MMIPPLSWMMVRGLGAGFSSVYSHFASSAIRIGDLPIIRDSEIQNFCLHGTVGAGKSEVT